MAIIKDITIKINNGTATLDAPLQFYEKDHDVELRFKLIDYKYKYDKDPQNILNSVDEDILEAYTTIVNPIGYELEQINGVVKNDIVIFRLDPTYTDELDEIGTYKLQIHIKCTCSEFTIPAISFEVLERLKGLKVVTDGEDKVDESEILDNSSKFVSDETGKLIIEWKKGDMISSAKLNAMVDVINDAVEEETVRQANEIERQANEIERQANEIERQQRAENKIQEVEDTRVEYINKIDTELDEFTDQINTSMTNYETRFNALTASQQQDAEVIDARDGETSLKARLDRDIEKAKQVYVNVEGSNISTDSSSGYAKDVEILGNTIQDASNLADIRSVGDKVEGQELYEIPVLSCGKNLFDKNNVTLNAKVDSSGNIISDTNTNLSDYIKLKANKTYCKSNSDMYVIYDDNKNFISRSAGEVISLSNDGYVRLFISSSANLSTYQLEEGTVATPYEPYQEDKLTILSPVQLEKVGDVADRIIEKDGVWGVEKNVVDFKLENLNIHAMDALNTTYRVGINSNLNIKTPSNYGYGTSLCNMLPFFPGEYYTRDEEHYYLEDTSGGFLFIDKNKFDGTKKGLNKYLEGKGYVIKYQLATPQFIPLPHDQQVKLRTFANKTNISFLTEIEGTIKAQVPKSLGATVNTHTEQINNLNKELDRVKKLEESTVSTVTTESDFTTVEATSNGYFEDVKLEGKTLVNLLKNVNWVDNEDSTYLCTEAVVYNPVGETVTFINLSDKQIEFAMNNGDNLGVNGSYISSIYIDAFSTKVINIPSGCGIRRLVAKYKDGWTADDMTTIKNKTVLLKGAYPNICVSYFEGLKSVGQDVGEISVESCYNVADIATEGNNNFDVAHIKKGVTYSISSKRSKNYGYNLILKPIDGSKDKVLVGGIYKDFTTFVSDVDGILVFNSYDAMDVSEIMILPSLYTEDTMPKFKPYSPDKKRLLYYNEETQTWEKPILRQWDSIEKHSDGKYYYHKRCEEVVFNGSENFLRATTGEGGSIVFYETTINNMKYTGEKHAIVDKFSVIGLEERFYAINNQCYTAWSKIYFKKDDVSDIQGFKQWLQDNNVTVVYQLAQEKVYECTNIDLITYANETNFIIESGVISPKTSLKVMCNINNVVRELQQKVSNLENYIQHVMIDALNNALNE